MPCPTGVRAVPDLILVLGDQLSPSLTALRHGDPRADHVLMAEVNDEATYVKHHKKKLVFFFSAMRHFAEHLRGAGWDVGYTALDDPANSGSLVGELERACNRLEPDAVVITQAGEWRVQDAICSWCEANGMPLRVHDDDRFFATPADFAAWATGRKQLRMEYFYRDMRRRTGLLMDAGQPVGGAWNFDAENRKRAPSDLDPPAPFGVQPDAQTRAVIDLVKTRFPDHIGSLEPFRFGVTHADAESALTHFIDKALPHFGDYQDAMLQRQRFLYHAVIALYLNVGLLDPLAVCKAAEAAYHRGHAPINAVEGFIRQILGWREYVRGIYWHFMPEYVTRNALSAERDLPAFYWTGETDMACLRSAITQTLEEAYAHHIQRLMLTGNFAMLVGVDPHQVHSWYLAVYADAVEWVELPNTLGMSQFGDGGLLGSKPYAAGGNYINKMSDHCKHCRYDVKQKTGPAACPFNALYWDFLARNADMLSSNPRMAQMYRTWHRFAPETQAAYRDSARAFLSQLR
ncbi:MAG: cryptochrome/photolyase family protein [Pseudomonadota bacterium]